MDDSKPDSNTKDSSSNISASLQSADNTTGNQLINNEHIDIAPNSITELIIQKPSQSEGTSLTLLTGQNAESQASNKPDPTCTPAAAPLNERTKPDPSDICGLCNCVLSAPRILSCFHVYDLHCLAARLTSSQNSTQTSGADVASGAHLQCPHATCRVVTPLVPPGPAGLASLPTDNALLLQLISKAARVETREAYRLKCSACVANEPACSLCIDCPALLCSKALESHKLLFSFLTHRVLQFEQILAASTSGSHDAACGNSTDGSQSTATAAAADAAAAGPSHSPASNETASSSDSKGASVGVGFSIPASCKSHHSPVDRFCFHCQRLLCEKCAADGAHRAHRTESLAAFSAPSGAAPTSTAAAAAAPAALQSPAMVEALAPLRAALDALAGRTLKRLKYSTDIVESITESDFTEAIQMQYDRLHEILKQRQEEMLRELNTYFPRYSSRREQEVAAWKSSVAQIETSRDFIQRQLSSGSALSALSLLPLMRERVATLSREVNERCREVLAMEALPRSEEALVRSLYGLEFKFDVDSFADAARRHLCVTHFPLGLGGVPIAPTGASAAGAACLSVVNSAVAARGGAFFPTAGGNPLVPAIGATVRTVNVLSAPVVANRARTGSSLRALQVQTATALRVQSSRGDAVVVQSASGVPGVVLPVNPIVRVMPGVPVAVSLHLASVGSAPGIRPVSVTCTGQPPHPFSTTQTTPTMAALMANASHEQSARGTSVEQRPSTRASDEVSREPPSNLDLYPRATVHQLDVKHEAIDGGAQASKQLYALRPRRSSIQRSRGLFGPDFITNAYDNVMGDEEEAEPESDASPSPKRRTRHYHSRTLTPAALDSSVLNAQKAGSSANPLPMTSNTADVKPPNGSLSLTTESRHSLPTASQAPAETSFSYAISQVGVLTPTVSSCGTVTKTKSLLKARSALRKVNLQPSPTAGSAPAVEDGDEGGPPAPKLRPWNHMPPEVKHFTKFHPKPINQYRCLPCNKWFGRDTKRLIHHVRSVHMAAAAGTSFSGAEFSSIDALASTPDPPAAADSSMASTSTAALTPSATNDSSKMGAKEFASDTSASSVRRNSDASVDSEPLASLASNTTQSKNSVSANTSSGIAKRRNNTKQRLSSDQLKETKGATGTTNKRPKKKHRRLTLTKRSRVSKPQVSDGDTAATSDRLFADFSESAAVSSNSTKAAASQPIDAAPERAPQTEASQSASTSAQVGEHDILSSTIDESKSKLASPHSSSVVTNKLPSRASHPKIKKNLKSASSKVACSSAATNKSQTNGSVGRNQMPLANLADVAHPGNYILYFLRTTPDLPTPGPQATGARKETKEKRRRQRIRWYECVLCSTRFGHDRIKGFDHVNTHHKDVLQRAREGVIHQKIAHLFGGVHHSTASATATTTSSSFTTAASSAPNGPQSADANHTPQKQVAPKSEAAGASPHHSSGESSEEATSPLDVLADAAAAAFASVSNETSTPIGPSARSVAPSRRSSPPKKKKLASRSPGEKAGNARRVKGTEQVQSPLKVEEATVSDGSTTALSEMHPSGSIAMVVQPTSTTDADGATDAVAESTPLRSPTRSHSRSNLQATRPSSSISSENQFNS